MKHKKAYALCMIMTIISFLGFLVENIWLALTRGYINNRNMLLPFLFGYGLSIIVMHFMFGMPQAPCLFAKSLNTGHKIPNILIFFGLVFVCVSVGEFVLGTLVEELFGIIWWDYTRIPLHISRYTSIPTSTGFAFLITLFMGCFFAPLCRLFMRMDDRVLRILACVFMSLMIADFVHSAARMMITHKLMLIWRIDLAGIFLRAPLSMLS